MFFQFLPGRPESTCLGNPEKHLQITHSARGVLAVWLQAIRRFVEAQITFLLLQALCLEKLQRIEMSSQSLENGFKQLGAACQQARFQERGHDGDIANCRFYAFIDSANAVPKLQADIPEMADQAFQFPLLRLIRFLTQEDQQIDIGGRVELTTAVTADSGKRDRSRK